MKRPALLLLLLPLLLSGPLHGEGLPVDENGRPLIPHTALTLSTSQKEELEALGTVTLSDTQWAAMRKVSPGTPKRLVSVLPFNYNDCACGERWDAILLKDGGIAVPHRALDADSLQYMIGDLGELRLHVDSRGQFHLEGILIRYPVLLQAIEAIGVRVPGKDGKVFPASISLPPGMSRTDPVFAERVSTVERLFTAKGWNGYSGL